MPLEIAPHTHNSTDYGLRRGALSPLETLAQSVSTIAPSTSPPATIPLVFALAGTGTALAYVVATALVILISLCIAEFARESSSPGSLYDYTRRSLPAWATALTAWALLSAYIATGTAVVGGFIKFAFVFLDRIPATAHVPRAPTAVLLATFAIAVAVWVAYRDIQISARLMLAIEAVSVLLIAAVIAITLFHLGPHLDHSQFALASLLRWPSARGVGLGVMLAIFSFVGFESATTLGAEAREPLRTIPRAVVQSALLAGAFFVLCGYGEVAGFAASPVPLDRSDAPFHFLAEQAHIGYAALVIDAGVLISAFAATLACVIAASRVLLLMAHDGLMHSALRRTSRRHETPVAASVAAGLLALAPTVWLSARGATASDIYNWGGTYSVYGFLTAYGMAAVALAFHLRKRQRLTPAKLLLTVSATLAILLALVSNFYPVPEWPLNVLPYIYFVSIAVALIVFAVSQRRRSHPSI